MDAFEKLRELGDLMRVEPAEETASGRAGSESCGPDLPVFHAHLPGGQTIPLLKTMLTSACERDCFYCAMRSGRDCRRTTFRPEELARAFMQMVARGQVRGLFLSSGMAGGGLRTQDRLLDTAAILRTKFDYAGYLHLKIMPGAERAQVEQAMRLADRVSINLEAPNPSRLANLAPHKVFMEELLRPLRWVEEIRRDQPAYLGWHGRWPSSTTQFVAGGARECDLELISTTQALNRQVSLSRAYFSRFSPVPGTPLEDQPACSVRRQHRLYQASFLLRDYGFDVEELPFGAQGNLPLEADPKLAWARANLASAPVEVNRAGREQLLRIPGIGPRAVQAILVARRQGRLRGSADLCALGIPLSRAAPFVLLDGCRPDYQPVLF